MKYSLGIDAIEISRIEKSIKTPGFIERVFSPLEIEYFEDTGMKAHSLAATFCAKEAFSKAIGTGIRGFALAEVQVIRNSLGKPSLHFIGNAAKIVAEKGLSFDLSLTHTDSLAMAVVIAYGDENK
ncbi:MAG: holo-ACP synthase [Ruminococcaceae bacterium]|nr:holo-ACP synthase [Oscillospiraceae bacterium]